MTDGSVEYSIQGIGVSAGVAVGEAFLYKPQPLSLPDRPSASPAAELQRFYELRAQAEKELESLYQQVKTSAGEESAQIFIGHKALLLDPALESLVQGQIESGMIVEAAVMGAADAIADMFEVSGDPVLASRAADVRDVGQRLLRSLLNLPKTMLFSLITPSIIAAPDLTPSDTASLDPRLAKGICLAEGGRTSHAAILARTLGIPAVFGLGHALIDGLTNGQQIALDGDSGQVIINPTTETLTRLAIIRDERTTHAEMISTFAHEPARTANGRVVHVFANVGDLASAHQAVAAGAEGIGLLRTEFLYLDRTLPPAEDEQLLTYRAIFDVMGDRPIVVRTLDVGGDKPPKFIDFPAEANPFLGLRGVRLTLHHADLFKTQLRAVLRAAVGKDVAIMYPMIDSLTTLERANAVLAEARAQLEAAHLPYAKDIAVGVMIETPAAAITADILIGDCDFFSIGTNDLTQYTLACDRNNAAVNDYFDPFNPAVLRLIKQVIDAAHRVGKKVGMCGELAGIPEAVPLLLGMGLDEFSMSPSLIPEAKWQISRFSDVDANAVARDIFTIQTSEEVRRYLRTLRESGGL